MKNADPFPKGSDFKAIATESYSEWPYRSVMGLSKDGRPIYTPYYGNGQEYDPCDLDVCNGIDVGGHYSYVSTLFHPYFMGCYGPGHDSDYAQSCSQNPRVCGELAVVNMSTSMRGIGGWLTDLFTMPPPYFWDTFIQFPSYIF